MSQQPDPNLLVAAEAAPSLPSATLSLRASARLGPVFWLSVGWLALVGVLAATASLLPLRDPNISDFSSLAAGPSAHHWLGTDAVGLDLLSRIIYGARVSLAVGLFSILIGLAVGAPLGAVAGYFRGKVEAALMTVADAMLSFPALILLLFITAFFGKTLVNIIIAIAVVTVPVFLRLARANTLVLAQREFVLAARSTGASSWRVLWREVAPNILPSLLTFGLLAAAVAIVAEGALSFMGLSVPPQTPTWGNIIAGGRQEIQTDPLIVLFPSVAMFLTVFALNLAGERLRSMIDARGGRR
ncbi:MAG TPA: ABC transporter permease [Acidimicrobiales bacterium]|nr:ABC transporter permease [Acidimicrobiales bacterium]